MRNASERGFALGSRVGRWRLRPALPFVAADQWRNMGSGIDLLNWMAIPLETHCQFPSRERCLGQPLSRPVAVAGDTIAIHLLLQASLVPPDDLALSAQLFGPDGERVAQEDLPLRLDGLGGSWPVGAVVRDERLLTMPADLLTGDYRLLIALYRMSDGETIASVTMDRAITVVAR